MTACLMLLVASAGPPNGLPPGAVARLGTAKISEFGYGLGEGRASVEYSGPGALVVRPERGQARKWDIATGKATPLARTAPPEPGQALSRDGRFLADFDEKGLGVTERKSGKRLLLASPKGGINSLAFSPDGRWFAAVMVPRPRALDSPSRLVVWDARSWKKRLERDDAFQVHFSPDGKRLAVSYLEGLEVVDLQRWGGRPARRFGGFADSFSWSASGRFLAAVEPGVVCVLDGRDGKALWCRRWEESGTMPVAVFSPDERMLAIFHPRGCSPYREGVGRVITAHSAADGQLLRQFTGYKVRVAGVAFSPRGDQLASALDDGSVLLWDLTGRMGRPCRLDTEAFARRWKCLGGPKAARAEAALWDIVCCAEAPALLRKVLRPQRGMAPERLRKLAADLGADDFDTRTRAEAALRGHGPGAAPALRKVAGVAHSLEVRLRIRRALQAWRTDSPRLARAVAALEKHGTPGAKALLRELAAGEPGAPLTEDAKAALRRLGK